MAGSRRAFLDASVLYPVSLRNLLMRLTLAGLYQARWSAHVHEEWIRSVLRDRPDLPPARLQELRAAMDERAEESLVTGYEPLIDSLALPDPDDRHVLAAAIVARADVIVTCNLRDFPHQALGPYQIEAHHPDEFIREMLEWAPFAVAKAVRAQQERPTNPPVAMPDLLALFERLGLTATVLELRRFMKL
jgi:predicted nucleic acid-binding protein